MNAVVNEDASVVERIRSQIQLSLQRGLKGVEYLSGSGPSMGDTPRDLITRRGTMALYHYRPVTDEVYRIPLLIVMALTNHGYIMDLAPGQSLIEFLLKRGYDVYMIDWNAPRSDESGLRIENYTHDFLPECVAKVQELSGEQDVNLAGYCMGGLLSSLYVATHPDTPVRNLAVFTTPINFTQMSLFAKWADKRHFKVDQVIGSDGNIPPEVIMAGFDMLRPTDRITGQIDLWDKMWNDEYVKAFQRLQRWGNEMIGLPGAFFRQFTENMTQENRLVKDELKLDGQTVRLSDIRVPLLHAVALHDHIVPPAAAAPLVERVSSEDKEEVILKGGHVSLVAGPNAVKRLWPKLDSWFGRRSV